MKTEPVKHIGACQGPNTYMYAILAEWDDEPLGPMVYHLSFIDTIIILVIGSGFVMTWHKT